MIRFFSVLFLFVFFINVAKAQEPFANSILSCSDLFKTPDSLASYQLELDAAIAKQKLHCGPYARFKTFDENKCKQLENKILAMSKLIANCKSSPNTSFRGDSDPNSCWYFSCSPSVSPSAN